MERKLKPKVCYVAGLCSKNTEQERNAVGVRTSVKEIEQRFIEIALTEFGIEPSKILVRDEINHVHVFFYHSRVAKQLKKLVSRETIIFKRRNEFAASYVAGMFDAAGHESNGALSINGVNASDQLMLQNLGVHTLNGRILNARQLVELIKGRSIMLQRIKLQ
ncbi:MAG: hypothetical protein KGH72_04365 [Candidatus Micrarchaeota archaeon]|nr:hypothetical protein [Candidatus Micrarchaeota archaeon]